MLFFARNASFFFPEKLYLYNHKKPHYNILLVNIRPASGSRLFPLRTVVFLFFIIQNTIIT